MDLVRLILLRAEDANFGTTSAEGFMEEGYDARTVAYHFRLLQQAGFVTANLLTLEREGAVAGTLNELTWDGHDYLDAVRNATVWAKTKNLVADNLGTASLQVFKAVATKLALKQLGIGDD